MSKNRTARIDGEMRRALSEIFLTDIKDPRMSSMAGVTRVEVTPDLKYAKVFVSVYDKPEKIESTMIALEKAEGFIRSKLNGKMKLRRIPTLTFVHDTSIEYSAKISKLIDEVTKKDRENSVQGHDERDNQISE